MIPLLQANFHLFCAYNSHYDLDPARRPVPILVSSKIQIYHFGKRTGLDGCGVIAFYKIAILILQALVKAENKIRGDQIDYLCRRHAVYLLTEYVTDAFIVIRNGAFDYVAVV